MRLSLFGKGDREKRAADKAKDLGDAARIKAEVRALLRLPETAVIAVNEILCADPACPGTETVILVMSPGEKTKAFKAQLAMAELTREALAEALLV